MFGVCYAAIQYFFELILPRISLGPLGHGRLRVYGFDSSGLQAIGRLDSWLPLWGDDVPLCQPRCQGAEHDLHPGFGVWDAQA